MAGAALSLLLSSASFAQGTYLSASGPVHRSMGGASTAAPLDSLGALFWNPATISGLPQSEMSFGTDLLYSNHRVTSTLGGLTGTTESENGFTPIPSVGWVYHTPDPRVTLGLSLQTLAGFKTNLMSDPTNPVLAPQPAGLGRVSSEAAFLQLAPVISIAPRDDLSFAIGPTVTMGQVELEPFVFGRPNSDGTFPSARSTRYHWGGGFQAGVYYVPDDCWRFGASFKSPQWMEDFRFFGEDGAGGPRVLRTKIDLPLILSFGIAYSGFKDWLLAADIRYFDYENTDGFGDPAAFASDGSLSGLGFDSVVAVALGAQRRLSERSYWRIGYTFNESPSAERESFFNIGAPLFYKHTISTGLSYWISPAVAFNLAYSYYLPSELNGPIFAPGIGAVPGSSVSNEFDVHVLSLGVTARY